MTGMRDIKDDIDLDRLFAAVRAVDHRPDDAFLARLVQEAEAIQPAPAVPPQRTAPPRRHWLSGLGGWPALGGLVVSALSGLWLGFMPPAGLTVFAAQVAGQTVEVGFYGEDDLLAYLED